MPGNFTLQTASVPLLLNGVAGLNNDRSPCITCGKISQCEACRGNQKNDEACDDLLSIPQDLPSQCFKFHASRFMIRTRAGFATCRRAPGSRGYPRRCTSRYPDISSS